MNYNNNYDNRFDSLISVSWKDDSVVLIDQTKLPNRLAYIQCRNYNEVADAIKEMVVRGAPAIGVTAALGLALAGLKSKATTPNELRADLDKAFTVLLSTRPTAVNLSWALTRVIKKAIYKKSMAQIKKALLEEALTLAKEDAEINLKIGMNGAQLFSDGDVVMTHCNAGSLATTTYGTALGVIRAAKQKGKRLSVIATETRPVMQGSRLTAFELQHDGIDVSLIPDTAVGYMMSKGIIGRVIVGADRILRTGHVFNKIGTYQIASMANMHGIPFYVAAPISTFDFEGTLQGIVIEDRSADELVKVGTKRIAPIGVRIFNPAFDITPPDLISAIVTEKGVLTPPYEKSVNFILDK